MYLGLSFSSLVESLHVERNENCRLSKHSFNCFCVIANTHSLVNAIYCVAWSMVLRAKRSKFQISIKHERKPFTSCMICCALYDVPYTNTLLQSFGVKLQVASSPVQWVAAHVPKPAHDQTRCPWRLQTTERGRFLWMCLDTSQDVSKMDISC